MHLAPAAGHERDADERAAARDHRATAGYDHELRRGAHRRLRRAGEAGRASTRRRPPPRSATCPAEQIREAARLIGTAERLLSTVLQGFYQSQPGHRGRRARSTTSTSSAACSASPGCGILQMNGQPTAQNTRECGADGDLPGVPQLVQRRARRGPGPGVERRADGHPALRRRPRTPCRSSATPRTGSIRFLWVSGTNPAVSLPELARIRSILAQERLFLVVQDIFLTETAQLADVVLPAATWGEKTGTFTNADRTVHLSEKAVEPPGEARPDLDIFLDFARRLGLQDKDGGPLVKWSDPEGAFEGVEGVQPRAALRLHRPHLRQAARRQRHPVAVQRRAPGRHRAALRRRAVLGDPGLLRELRPGPGHRRAGGAETEYRALNPDGKAVLKAAEYLPPHELPSEEYPFQLITGRTALPLPHPHQDRPGTAAAGRRARGVGGDVRRLTPPTAASPRATCCEVTTPRGPGARRGCGSAASGPACCSCRSTTATGTPPAATSPTAPAGPPTS